MGCRICNRDSDDWTHEYCRAHSFCSASGGSQYHMQPCYVCKDLLDRASDTDNPDDAIHAFNGLTAWILGFRKNSKHRPAGQDYFLIPAERTAVERLHALHAAHPHLRQDSSVSSQGSVVSWPSLSVLVLLVMNFAYTSIIVTCTLLF